MQLGDFSEIFDKIAFVWTNKDSCVILATLAAG